MEFRTRHSNWPPDCLAGMGDDNHLEREFSARSFTDFRDFLT